ncbi:hypothetical protein DH86_00002036 [Scytalidium sp. 3C]|nr:hypothetical protein DH86_00002036 [Scytalidium sp. 3C]
MGEKDDSLNTTLGGFLAGSVLGLRFGTTPAVLGMGALTAVVLGTYDYAGGKLTGYKGKFEDDEFEKREAARLNRRRPIQEVHAIQDMTSDGGRGSRSIMASMCRQRNECEK